MTIEQGGERTPECEALIARRNLAHDLCHGFRQSEVLDKRCRYHGCKSCQYHHGHGYAVVMVSVRGQSDTKVREQSQHDMRAMPFCAVPTVAVTALIAVALNTGMVKSCEITCERVQHEPQLHGM